MKRKKTNDRARPLRSLKIHPSLANLQQNKPRPRWKWTKRTRLALRIFIGGGTYQTIATACGVHRHTVRSWIRSYEFAKAAQVHLEEAKATKGLHRLRVISVVLDHIEMEMLEGMMPGATPKQCRASMKWLPLWRQVRAAEREEFERQERKLSRTLNGPHADGSMIEAVKRALK